jgi:hypothetical protein
MIEDETPDHNSAKNQIFIKKKKWSWIAREFSLKEN